MVRIYKIVNDVTDKVYVGQTARTLKERWWSHLSDAHRERCKNRLLYVDMRLYGSSHFSIVLLEEVEDNLRYDREKFWIAKLHAFDNGYNETYGGQGKPFINYELLYHEWINSNKTITDIANEQNCSVDSVRLALTQHCVAQKDIIKRGLSKAQDTGKSVAQLDLKGETIICIFPSLRSVALTGFCPRHVTDVCKHRIRKTHKGYKWAFVSELEKTNPDLLKKYYEKDQISLDKQ